MASPIMIMPGVRFVEGGRKEFGIDRNEPLSSASLNEGCTHLGKLGRTTFLRWPFTPPLATEAEGRPSGTSIRARVSWVPI